MSNPQQLRPSNCVLSEAETARVTRLIARVGTLYETRRLLGLSAHTFDAARGFGRMQKKTRDRLLATLDSAEAGA